MNPLTLLSIGAGLLVLALYWWGIRPDGSGLGYSGDHCSDIVRQIMAENLSQGGKLKFSSDQFLAPFGASMPFMSWSIERDWLGAFFWQWSPEFPFRWAFYGLSLLVTYVGTGWLLGKLALGARARWVFALAAVLLHVPRHYKTWHHYEHLPQHWVYLSFFLDAWIWKRFKTEGKWSWELELWRFFLQLGAFTATGYFWGITSFEWLVVRASLLGTLFAWKWRPSRAKRVVIEGSLKRGVWAIASCICLLLVEVQWFSALFQEIKSAPPAYSNLGWFATPLLILMPLWRPETWQAHWLPALARPETLITIGWYWLIPLVLSFIAIARKRGGPGVGRILPFALFTFSGVLYVADAFPVWLQHALPFMSFFRVASRWGLFFPELAAVMIALCWPELGTLVRRWVSRPWGKVALVAFLVSSAFELSWLALPVSAQPAIPEPARKMLETVRDLPGTTVLDLPFCVAGGNGVCTEEQCPQYPQSTAGLCLRQWHHKKVYGLYHPRMLESQCEFYRKAPYQAWFQAWRQKRCFNEADWTQFCAYLKSRADLSAVLLYSGIWKATEKPECLAQFTARLGLPLDQVTLTTSATRDGLGADPTDILRFAPHCR